MRKIFAFLLILVMVFVMLPGGTAVASGIQDSITGGVGTYDPATRTYLTWNDTLFDEINYLTCEWSAPESQISLFSTGTAEAIYQTAADGEWIEGTFAEAIADVHTGGTVKLLQDIYLTATATLSKDMTITSSDPAEPKMITCAINGHGYLLNISSGTLTLENVIVDGGYDEDADEKITSQRALIAINGGKLVLETGTEICNNYNATVNGAGGGLCLISGSVKMNGGSIHSNYAYSGGGVAVIAGEFAVTDGEISANTAETNGGGVYLSSGSFTMSDGSISQNHAKKYGGGLYQSQASLYTSGKLAASSVLTITGGSITENTAYMCAGMYISAPLKKAWNGEGEWGSTIFSGAEITQNTATLKGGGVLVAPYLEVTVSGSTKIHSNSAPDHKNFLFDNDVEYGFDPGRMVVTDSLAADAVLYVDVCEHTTPYENVKQLIAVGTDTYSITQADFEAFKSDNALYTTEYGEDSKVYLVPAPIKGLTFHITSKDVYDITVPTGTEITVSFTVENENDASYTMSRLQNEIYFDHTFFAFVEGSGSLAENRLVNCKEQVYSTDEHRVYVNHIDDKNYSANQFVASFQLRVLATEEGASSIIESKSQKATKKVTDDHGQVITQEFDPIAEKNLTVRIGNPVVTFDSMGGTEIEPVPVVCGEKVSQPENPTKEGHSFAGWYTSEDGGVTLSDAAYNFLTPVTSSFTLYAKWTQTEIPIDPPADDTAEKEIMIGIRGIDDPVKEVNADNAEQYQYLPSDYLYMGMYDSKPILWRVLDADKTNIGTPGMFLLSELLYGATPTDQEGTIYFADPYVGYLENGKYVYYQDETKQAYANDYQGSQVQDWCTGFATTKYFTQNELNAIPAVTKIGPVQDDNEFGKWTLGNLNNEKIFCLSGGEVVEYMANYQRASALKANPYFGEGRAYWLRSAKYNSTDIAGMVTRHPIVTTYGVREWDANMRPAMNLDLDAILFTSAAIDGKSDTVDSDLKLIPNYTGNEWKATIYDASRSAFDAEFVSAIGAEWTISYSNAVTGSNEYISALITDENGDAVYYGNLALVDDASKTNGTVVVTLPEGFDPSKNTLYIFNEQRNDNKQTDYSGYLIPIEYKEVPKYTVTYDLNGGTGADGVDYDSVTVSAGTEVTVKAAPTRDGYTFTGWSDGTTTYQPSDTITVNSNITLTAQWKKIDVPVAPDPDIPIIIPIGSVELTKVDAEDYSTVLPGVVFELYRANGSKVGTYTTNANGEIRVSSLIAGNYYWKEIRTVDGYVLDETEHSFTVSMWKTTFVVVENEQDKQSDVPDVFIDDHYAYIVGYDDGLVHPEANITRAEVATIFFRLLDEETRNQYMTRENNFTDVEAEAWYNTAVSTMAAMGIVTGRPGGIFDPNANITRAEFAAIAARFDASGNTTGASFTDIYDHWAKKEINIAANNGWVLGYEDGTFRPDQYITRAEAMTMVNRVLQRIPESVDDLLPGMIVWPDNMDTDKWYYLMVQEATNSHYYVRKDNGYESWTNLREVPDWAELER